MKNINTLYTIISFNQTREKIRRTWKATILNLTVHELYLHQSIPLRPDNISAFILFEKSGIFHQIVKKKNLSFEQNINQVSVIFWLFSKACQRENDPNECNVYSTSIKHTEIHSHSKRCSQVVTCHSDKQINMIKCDKYTNAFTVKTVLMSV